LAAEGGGGGAAPQPPGPSPRNFGVLTVRALVAAAALFPAGRLGSSWFAVLEAFQNAYYVLTTRGSTPSGPAPPGIGVVAGTPSERVMWLDILAQQIMLGGLASSASMELRRLGLEAVHQICNYQVIPYSLAGKRYSRSPYGAPSR